MHLPHSVLKRYFRHAGDAHGWGQICSLIVVGLAWPI